jgi:hypothetical protein
MAMAICHMARNDSSRSGTRCYDAAVQFPGGSTARHPLRFWYQWLDHGGSDTSTANSSRAGRNPSRAQGRAFNVGLEALEHISHSQESVELNDTPPDVSHWYRDSATARVALQCWAVVIQVNGAIAALHSFLSGLHIEAFAEGSMMVMQLESKRHAEDICKSVEYAKQYTPVESLFMSYPIFCAWTALPGAKKDWMVTELNHLNSCLMSDYNHAIMDYIAKHLVGCAIPRSNEIPT